MKHFELQLLNISEILNRVEFFEFNLKVLTPESRIIRTSHQNNFEISSLANGQASHGPSVTMFELYLWNHEQVEVTLYLFNLVDQIFFMMIRFFCSICKQTVPSLDGPSTRVYCISTRSIFEYDNHRTRGLKIGSQVQGYLSIRFELLFLFSLILSSQGHLDLSLIHI